MPKRSHDTSLTSSMDKVQKKTERSHEENQERAYIAASRRADRSIEARVQSARMASSIHKKRTGRGFKVTEEIVMKEEMYEEEEDEFPRHYRALTAHLQTGSSDMNSKLNAYVSNHVALANLAHQQQVDRMFAEQFPNAAQISRRMSNSMCYQQPPLDTNQSNSQFSPSDYSSTGPSYKKRGSTSATSGTLASLHHSMNRGSASPVSRHASVDDTLSPPALTPGSGSNSETPQNTTPIFSPAHGFSATAASIDPLIGMDQNPPMSAFTSELPAETKMLANFDPNDPLTTAFYGDSGEMMGSDGYCNYVDQTSLCATEFVPVKAESQEYFSAAARHANFAGGSRIGTPGGGQGDSWESWVQYD